MYHALLRDNRIVVGLWALVVTTVFPFVLYNSTRTLWITSAIFGLLFLSAVALSAWNSYFHGRRLSREDVGKDVVVLANICVLLGISADQNSVFWVYPLIFINFYLLSQGIAFALSLLVSALSIWLMHSSMAAGDWSKLAGAIPLCIFFALMFSESIGRQKKQLKYRAEHDALTGMGNRTRLKSILDDARQRLVRYGETSTIIMLDLDHFKTVNDTFGHICGDEVLIEVAKLLRKRVRMTDQLFRFGGEEFVIFMPHTAIAEGYRLAEAIRGELEKHRFRHDRIVTCSGGVSELIPGESSESWLDRADRALYRAKASGRNRLIEAEPMAA